MSLDNQKRDCNAVLGRINKERNLSKQRQAELANVDPRLPQRVAERVRAEIRAKYDAKLFEQGALSRQIADRAQQRLEVLQPRIIEERADFPSGADALAYTMKIQSASPESLRVQATLARQEGSFAKTGVLRREVSNREDLDRETIAEVFKQIDSMPLPDSVLESAQAAIETMKHAKLCEFEVRSTVNGHRLNPIERLAAARELQAVEDRISAWGKPKITPTPEDAAEPTVEPMETPATENTASDTREGDSQGAVA